MCCLFGLMDPRHILTLKQKNRLVSALALAAEERGRDATGIAFNSGGRLTVFKRPLPAHAFSFRVPLDAWAVMGHTRMTTQGSARRNRNNHPFTGRTAGGDFALAHNGVLCNDDLLRKQLHLPATRIETDSYIAVQLIEKQNDLSFRSLRWMAERTEGSFTYSLLDQRDTLWLVKGDSPLCLYQDRASGLYIYASTEEILNRALKGIGFLGGDFRRLALGCGEILRISADGTLARSRFDDAHLFTWYTPFQYPAAHRTEATYLEEIKEVAAAFGYTPEAIDELSAMGFSPEELEEYLYCGEL